MLRIPVIAMLALYALAVALGVRMHTVEETRPPDELSIPSVETAKVLSLGFRELFADLYLMKAAQYFGNNTNGQAEYRYLPPLVELISELDPGFREPLLWGGIAVQKNIGHDTWMNIGESTRLLTKGARRFPGDYRFHIYLAYNLMNFNRDYRAAAAELSLALNLPGTPDYVAPLISRLYTSAGDLETAEHFARVLSDDTADPGLKEVMHERVLDVQTERLLELLDAGSEEYKKRFGHYPQAPIELVTSGVMPNVPVDPRGGELSFTPDGTARSDKLYKRLKVFHRPGEMLGEAHESGH